MPLKKNKKYHIQIKQFFSEKNKTLYNNITKNKIFQNTKKPKMIKDEKIIKNVFWRLTEKWATKLAGFAVGVVVARAITPKSYGVVAIVNSFILLVLTLVDGGLGTALIQKKEIDDYDYSSVFWFNIITSLVIYLLVFLLSPNIAAFYNNNNLIPIIRALGLAIVISGINNIQYAYVSKNLLFNKTIISTLSGAVCGGVVGVVLAYNKFEAWALVAQHLTTITIETLVLWSLIKWKPKKLFSLTRFVQLFGYGWKILLSNIIDTTYNELRSLIIGKYYSSEDLAFYSKGSQFPKTIVENINTSINSVLLPVLSEKQEDLKYIKEGGKTAIRLSSFFICPLMIGLCVIADKLIVVLLTEKWLPATKYVRILCFNQILQPLQTINLSMIKAIGKSDIHLKIEIIKKTIATFIILATSMLGVEEIAVGTVVYAIIALYINSYPNKKMVDYGCFEQLKDIGHYIWMSFVMGAMVFVAGLIQLPTPTSLIIQIFIGIVVYFELARITKAKELSYYVDIIKLIIKNTNMKNEKNI